MFYNHKKPYYKDNEKQLKLDYVFACDICNKFSKADDLKPEKFTVSYGPYIVSHWFYSCPSCTQNKCNLIICLDHSNKIISIKDISEDMKKIKELSEADDMEGTIAFLRERFVQ